MKIRWMFGKQTEKKKYEGLVMIIAKNCIVSLYLHLLIGYSAIQFWLIKDSNVLKYVYSKVLHNPCPTGLSNILISMLM